MHWFRKEPQPDIWDVADDQPLGDIGAAQKIRDICVAAGSIAMEMAAAGGRKAGKMQELAAERYQAAIKRALETAMTISDEAMRDVSVSQIIRLCVRVNHLKTARVLLRALHSDRTRAELIAESPVLSAQDAAS